MFSQAFSDQIPPKTCLESHIGVSQYQPQQTRLNHRRVLTDVSWSCSYFKMLAGWEVKVDSIGSQASPVVSAHTVLWFGQSHCHFTGISCHLRSVEVSHRSAPACKCWESVGIGEHWWRQRRASTPCFYPQFGNYGMQTYLQRKCKNVADKFVMPIHNNGSIFYDSIL